MVLVTDTVGFIRKLPPTIVTAFRATLEELDEASLLLHVVDLASPNAPEQCQTVEDILADLNLTGKPRITALNKIDLLLGSDETWDEKSALGYLTEQCGAIDETTVLVSSTRGWGLIQLRQLIGQALAKSDIIIN